MKYLLHFSIILVLLMMSPLGALAGSDKNGDGYIDKTDLFLSGLQWEETFYGTDLLQLAHDWHTVFPATVAALQLTACRSEDFLGNELEVTVDLLDSRGRLVNPGLPGGALETHVNLTLTGAARFSNGQPATSALVNLPQGNTFKVRDTLAEAVIVTATAGGSVASASLELRFLPAGKISGAVQVYDSAQGGYRDPKASEVAIFVLDPTTQTTVATTAPGFFFGLYSTPNLAPGHYDLAFVPVMPDSLLSGACIRSVTIEAGLTTANTNAQMPLRPAGARISGTVSARDGGLLRSLYVTLTPATGGYCFNVPLSTVAFKATGALSLDYAIRNAPPGDYLLTASGVGMNSINYTLAQDLPLTVGTNPIALNLDLLPVLSLEQVAPIGYARTDLPFTLEWITSATAAMEFDVQILDRCGQKIWDKTGLTGSPAIYDGPSLLWNTLYNWTVSGRALDGSAKATGFPPTGQSNFFLVEPPGTTRSKSVFSR